MIKNIPNKYTQEMLIQLIEHNYSDCYDFFYLPMDLVNMCNMGYAFINFVNIDAIESFFKEFNNKKWPHFKSNKIC